MRKSWLAVVNTNSVVSSNSNCVYFVNVHSFYTSVTREREKNIQSCRENRYIVDERVDKEKTIQNEVTSLYAGARERKN
jgi:hypothetical protein